MKKQSTQAPAGINYQVQQVIEQMVSPLYKGTDLGMVDVMSAMLSGYFIESGGAITPAVDQYLLDHVPDEKEREDRTYRAIKAISYGQYNLNELIAQANRIMEESDRWKPTVIQGYRLKPVDITSFKRANVKDLRSKAHDSTAKRALPATLFSLMGTTGIVNGQRMAKLDLLICGETDRNDLCKEMEELYKQVSKQLEEDELAIMDAGFSLIDAVIHGIERCVIRLATNCTFGKTPGEVPVRTSDKGRTPTRHQADIVRPLTRQHGKKMLPATEPDETLTIDDELGREVRIDVWNQVYFLERHLDRVTDKAKKKKLRKQPLRVVAIHHPDFKKPLLLGTPIQELTPQSMMSIYPERWPVEGIPQVGKYILSGGGGRHYVHTKQAMKRFPALTMIFGSLFKFLAATFPPIRTGFWDRFPKATYGRLLKYLKKVGIPISEQLSKKASVTAHLPVGYEAIRLSKA